MQAVLKAAHFLFSFIYTDFIRETDTGIKIFKYANNKTIVRLLNFKNLDTAYHF